MGYGGTKIFLSKIEEDKTVIENEIEVAHCSHSDVTYINNVAIDDYTLQEIFEHCVSWGIVDVEFTKED
jgi:hypothetical protein